MIVLQLARALIEELEPLSHGTIPRRVPVGQNSDRGSWGPTGTVGTGGTSGTAGDCPAVSKLLPRAFGELIERYEERVALVLEGGDIGEPEAHEIAEAECGESIVLLRARLLLRGKTGGKETDDQGQTKDAS